MITQSHLNMSAAKKISIKSCPLQGSPIPMGQCLTFYFLVTLSLLWTFLTLLILTADRMLTVCGKGAIFSCFFLSERTQARGKRKESIKGESRARGARQVSIVLIALFLSRGTHPSHTFHAHLALTSTMSPFLRHFFTSE